MNRVVPSVPPKAAVGEVERLVLDQPGVRGVYLSEVTITVTNTALCVILPLVQLLRSKGINCPLNFKLPVTKVPVGQDPALELPDIDPSSTG